MTQASSTRRPLLKSVEVCEIANVQPYVLRSWEKEFPNLGVSKDPDGPRFYRKADLDEVLRIKQLVYGEGLTIAGARRKLEEERTMPPAGLPFDDDEDPLPAGKSAGKLSAKVRTRLDGIRKGLRAILELLEKPAGHAAGRPNGQTARVAAAAAPGVKSGRTARTPQPASRAKGRRSSAAARH